MRRSFVMRVMLSPTLVLIGLVLGSVSLQLQSASAYRYRGRVKAQSSISLIPNVEQYFQVSYYSAEISLMTGGNDEQCCLDA